MRQHDAIVFLAYIAWKEQTYETVSVNDAVDMKASRFSISVLFNSKFSVYLYYDDSVSSNLCEQKFYAK